MKVVCYYRHSTDSAQQDANSIDKQKHFCVDFAVRNSWQIIKEVADKGESGAGDKTNLMALAKDVEEGRIKFDTLLVYDQSRVTRKDLFHVLEDIDWLDKNGIKIACVNENDRVPKSIASWAKDPAKFIKVWQNNVVVQDAANQAADGMLRLHKEKKLSWVGIAPFGWRRVEMERPEGVKDRGKPFRGLVPDEEEAKIVQEVFDKYLDGHSVRSLSNVLAKASKYEGKYPNSSTVRTLLRNPIHAGIWAFGVRNVGKYQTVNGEVPENKKRQYYANALENAASIWDDYVQKNISKKQFLEAQRKLDGKSRQFVPVPVGKNYRYTGLLKCGCCGGSMTPQKRIAKNRKINNGEPYEQIDYRCVASMLNQKKCREGEKPWAKMIPEQDVDHLFQMMFAEVSCKGGFHWNLVKALSEEMKATSGIFKAELGEELAGLEIEEKKIKKAFEDLGGFPDWLLDKQRDVLEKKQDIEEKLSAAAPFSSYVKGVVDEYKKGVTSEAGRYLDLVYSVVQDYALDGYEWTQEEKKKRIWKLIEAWIEGSEDGKIAYISGEELEEGNSETEEGFVGFTFKDAEDCRKMLLSIGLTGGILGFRKTTPEEKRGGRWIPESLSLDFAFFEENTAEIGNALHTLTGVRNLTDGSMSVTIRTE